MYAIRSYYVERGAQVHRGRQRRQHVADAAVEVVRVLLELLDVGVQEERPRVLGDQLLEARVVGELAVAFAEVGNAGA